MCVNLLLSFSNFLLPLCLSFISISSFPYALVLSSAASFPFRSIGFHPAKYGRAWDDCSAVERTALVPSPPVRQQGGWPVIQASAGSCFFFLKSLCAFRIFQGLDCMPTELVRRLAWATRPSKTRRRQTCHFCLSMGTLCHYRETEIKRKIRGNRRGAME